MKFMVINGPNINMIGVREKGIYGSKSFTEICEYIKEEGEKRGHEVTLLQSNCEGTMIDFLQRAYFEKFDGVVINPGAYTHYSIALHDAIKGNTGIPTVEVHISNVHAREEFRKESKTAPACIGQMCGFGEKGYVLAMEALEDYITKNIVNILLTIKIYLDFLIFNTNLKLFCIGELFVPLVPPSPFNDSVNGKSLVTVPNTHPSILVISL